MGVITSSGRFLLDLFTGQVYLPRLFLYLAVTLAGIKLAWAYIGFTFITVGVGLLIGGLLFSLYHITSSVGGNGF